MKHEKSQERVSFGLIFRALAIVGPCIVEVNRNLGRFLRPAEHPASLLCSSFEDKNLSQLTVILGLGESARYRAYGGVSREGDFLDTLTRISDFGVLLGKCKGPSGRRLCQREYSSIWKR